MTLLSVSCRFYIWVLHCFCHIPYCKKAWPVAETLCYKELMPPFVVYGLQCTSTQTHRPYQHSLVTL